MSGESSRSPLFLILVSFMVRKGVLVFVGASPKMKCYSLEFQGPRGLRLRYPFLVTVRFSAAQKIMRTG